MSSIKIKNQPQSFQELIELVEKEARKKFEAMKKGKGEKVDTKDKVLSQT
jgi:hypothetical protein